MDSWLDNALAEFERENDALVLATRSLLTRIISDDPLHGRLINTLSLLEHLGSHKIMSTQHSAGIDQATLKHVAEEAYHAYFMKRQAEKAAARPLEYRAPDLLAPAGARMYFQRLEAAMARKLAGQRSLGATYLYMSLVVEFRALWFYRLYEQTLKRAAHAMTLKRVLGEERNHLEDVANRLEMAAELSDARVREFLGTEKKLYARLLEALQRAVAVPAAA
ncbi:MAG TPA: hypothetical protein VFV10_17805 [Gammaproteobacteria bacterium]|nr:hypothetical protein [Gammaproteobacteria bacterium]